MTDSTTENPLTCARCGDFNDKKDLELRAGNLLCAKCLEIPGVDHLQVVEDAYRGKRDEYVWLFGGLGTAICFFAILHFLTMKPLLIESLLAILLSGVAAAFFVSYFLLYSWTRKAIVPGTVILNVSCCPLWGIIFPGAALIVAIIPFIFVTIASFAAALSAHFSLRNKLAFSEPVTEAELEKLYDWFFSNQMARSASHFAFLGLLVPGLGLLGIVYGVLGLKRVNPTAIPPIGGRRNALIGIGVGGLAILKDGLLLLYYFSN